MDSEDKFMNIHDEVIIKNKKRGNLLNYSLSQVATLLNEEDSSIRYYTNVFDNILKIEISDKELRYTNRDIDKLEFLINLKNKGMTIKEIQKYCEELPLNIDDIVEIKENNSVSIKEIVTTIVDSESEKINNLKEHLSNKIDENHELSIQKIIKLIGEEQNKQLKLLKEDILNEMKEYIDYKFDTEYKTDKNLLNELSLKIDSFIFEKNSLSDNIKLQLNEYKQLSTARDNNLIDEIKRFKNVIEKAYYIQQEIESQKEKIGFTSFIGRLFGTR